VLLGGEHGSPGASGEDMRVSGAGFVISAGRMGPGVGVLPVQRKVGECCKCREPRSGIIFRQSSLATLSQSEGAVNSVGGKTVGRHLQSQGQSGAVRKFLQKSTQLPHLLPKCHVLMLCLSTQGCHAARAQSHSHSCLGLVSALRGCMGPGCAGAGFSASDRRHLLWS